MAEAMPSSDLPSSALRDRVAVLTEEGLELESRVLAFAAEADELARQFGTEVGPLCLDDTSVNCAAVRGGLVVLHALVERMATGLTDALGGAWDIEAAA